MGQIFLTLSDRGRNGAARWLGGTLLVLFCWFVVGGLILLPFIFLSGDVITPTGQFTGGNPLVLFIGEDLSFLGIWLGLWLTLRFLFHRPFLTLVTPAQKINWIRLAQGFGVWLLLTALFQVLEFVIYPARAVWTFNPSQWLLFLPFVLILTPIQTSAEELLFRGFGLQGVGRLTRNVIVLVVVIGILFALPHMLNPEVTNNPASGIILFLSYFATGAALAFYTLRDNRLELALGAHLSNNLFASLIVNYNNSAVNTPSFFTNPVIDANLGLVTLIITTIAFYFIIFRLLDGRAAKSTPAADTAA